MTNTFSSHVSDVLVVGCGAAGLTSALRLADAARVTVLAKGPLSEGSTYYAQGGISAVLDDQDSLESHIEDTLVAGAGLCHARSVRFTVEHAPESIEWLIQHGVAFTTEARANGSVDYHLTREGGYRPSSSRALGGLHGSSPIQTNLEEHARQHPNIVLRDHHSAIDLITTGKMGLSGNRCLGAYVLNQHTGEVEVFSARLVVLGWKWRSQPSIPLFQSRWFYWRWQCHGLASRLPCCQYGIYAISPHLPLSSPGQIVLSH
ncbi:MAG: FAD-dependent oxidoreductase [Candidatus Competibacteraceae bacterium]